MSRPPRPKPTHPASEAPGGPRRFLVTTAPGLENLLAEELRELGLEPVPESPGVMILHGDWPDAVKVLVRSRIASRVLLSLRKFSARNKAMLYDQVRRIPWPELFAPTLTIAVNSKGSVPDDANYVLSFATLRIKDAICDEYRKFELDRPNVDRQDPDVRLEAFFLNGRCELSVDLSGAPLHRRGYREEGSEAPLRENRAAALLRFCGYDGSQPLVDPFCGSGTIPIEAALMARRIAPGLLRPLEAFALGVLFPETRKLLADEMSAARLDQLPEAPAAIAGSDIDASVLGVARENAVKAGVEEAIAFATADARELVAEGHHIVVNPPYGERLMDRNEAADLLNAFTHQVKHTCAGSILGLVVPRGPLENSVGFRPSRRITVESGTLTTRFLRFEIYAGSRRGEPAKRIQEGKRS